MAKFKQWAEGTSNPVPGWAIASDGKEVKHGEVQRLEWNGHEVVSCPQWEEEVEA